MYKWSYKRYENTAIRNICQLSDKNKHRTDAWIMYLRTTARCRGATPADIERTIAGITVE